MDVSQDALATQDSFPMKEPLVTQEKLATQETFSSNEPFPSQEKLATQEKLVSQEPLATQNTFVSHQESKEPFQSPKASSSSPSPSFPMVCNQNKRSFDMVESNASDDYIGEIAKQAKLERMEFFNSFRVIGHSMEKVSSANFELASTNKELVNIHKDLIQNILNPAISNVIKTREGQISTISPRKISHSPISLDEVPEERPDHHDLMGYFAIMMIYGLEFELVIPFENGLLIDMGHLSKAFNILVIKKIINYPFLGEMQRKSMKSLIERFDTLLKDNLQLVDDDTREVLKDVDPYAFFLSSKVLTHITRV